jgi:queuosine precursor transporter
MDTRQVRMGVAALLVYGLSIFLANWMIRMVGTVVLPDGTHLLPVGFGLLAPSGTFAAGITFVARDVVQRTIGKRWSLLIIIPGALLTALLDVRLAVASASAFLFSESVDFLVYTPLQRRGFVRAVFASGIVASVVDSFLFLTLAGIPIAVALPGLLLGKVWVMLIAAPVAALLRSRLSYAKTIPIPASAGLAGRSR